MKNHFLILFFFNLLSSTFAQSVSFDANDILQNVKTVNPHNQEISSFTLFRDYTNRKQWYYLPQRIRFAEHLVSGQKPIPKVKFLKWQRYNPFVDRIEQAGMMLASFTIKASPEEEEQMTKFINAKYPNSSLTNMRFEKSQFSILPLDAEFYKDKKIDTTLYRGSLSGAEFSISLPLSDIGVAVMSKLPIAIQNLIEYKGISAPCGGSISGSYESIYKFHQKTKDKGWGLKLGFVSLGSKKSSAEISEELKKISDVKIDILNCEGGGADALLKEAITNINKEIYTNSDVELANVKLLLDSAIVDARKLGKMDVLAALLAEAKGYSARLESQSGTKDISKSKKGNFRFQISNRQYVQKIDAISSIIGLDSYKLTDEEIEKMTVELDIDKSFPTMVYGLPIYFSEEAGVKTATITVTNPFSGRTKSARWANDKWVDEFNQTIYALRFANLGYKIDNSKKVKVEMSISTNVTNNIVSLKKEVSPINGNDNNFDMMDQLIHRININPSQLSFKSMTLNEGDLTTVKVSLIHDGKTYSKDFSPVKMSDGTYSIPKAQFMIAKKHIDENISQIQIRVMFKASNKQQLIPWIYNGALESSDITFDDSDWKGDFLKLFYTGYPLKMKTLIITVSLVLNINTILAQKYAINHGLDIPLLDQLLTKDSADCWLYCATMIHSWKHQTSFSLIEVGNFATHNSKAKYNYLKRYIKRNKNGEQLGLPFSKTTDFAEAMGWQPLLQSPGVSNIFEILQTHGPIVFFHNPNPEILNNTNGHVMLIVGIRFDDLNYGDYTFLEVYDPWHGKNYEITFSDYEKFYLTASAKLQNYLFHY